METMKKQILNFLEYWESVKRRSSRTLSNYHLYLERFLKFCEKNNFNDLSKINAEFLRKYNAYLSSLKKPQMNMSTQNYHLIALRMLLKYCSLKKQGFCDHHKIKLAKMEKKKSLTVPWQTFCTVLDSPLSLNTPLIIRSRDKAILELLASSGLKVSELSHLQKKDFSGKTLLCRKPKMDRELALSNQAQYWIKEYLQKRKDNRPNLFISHDKADLVRQKSQEDAGLSSRSIERIVKRYGQVQKQKITPQILRNTYILHKLSSGENPKDLKTQLGLKSNSAMMVNG
jgi:site-specific recombinase XerD